MAIEQKNIEFAKEADDVLKLVVDLIKGLKEGQNVVDLSKGLLPELFEAVSNSNQIPEEFKNKKAVLQTVLLRAADLVDLFV